MFKLIFLLSLVLLTQGQQLKIWYISSSPTSIVHPVYSSQHGGRFIYIKVSGHSSDSSKNQISIGKYSCNIPSDGVTDNFITCITGDTGTNLWNFVNFTLTLVSKGKTFTTQYPDTVFFYDTHTPYLHEIYPTAGFAGSNIRLYGVHKITKLGDGGRDLGEIISLKIGSDICSSFDINQTTIASNSQQYIRCKQSPLQEAGKYRVSQHLVIGVSDNNPNLRRASLTNDDYYEYIALPTIIAVSPREGNLAGQKISIEGTGFSTNSDKNKVTIDGNICQITQSSQTHLQCDLPAKDPTKTSKLLTNSTTQTNGFQSGSGLNYVRYSVPNTSTIANFTTAVRNNNISFLGEPKQKGFRAELREGNQYGTYYGQVWRGYFSPKVTGKHIIQGMADDAFALYFSNVYGSTELPTTPLIYSNSFQYDKSFYESDVATAEAEVTLEQGKSYYLQAYHLNLDGFGYFKIIASSPNSDSTLPFQSYQVDKIITDSTIQNEVLTYSMIGGSNGTINLRIYRVNSQGSPIYDVSANISYGCTATEFVDALLKFDGYSKYSGLITRIIYDSSNNIISTLTGASRIDYIVSFKQLRPTLYLSEDFIVTNYGYTGTFSRINRISHSPLITGTFILSIGGVTIKPIINGVQSTVIPFDVAEYTLQTAIRKIVGFEEIEVYRYSYYGAGYSNTWIIRYKGYNGIVPALVVNGAGLSGGATTPTITVTKRRSYSTDIIFDPVDYRFLSTPSSTPNVLVEVNNISAVCINNCSYSFNNWIKINSISRSGNLLTLGLSNPSNLLIKLASITVTVGNSACIVQSGGTISAFTCKLKTNNDGSPNLIAGSLSPIVYVQPYGYAVLATGVNPLSVSHQTDSLSKHELGNNGGNEVSLKGNGFPDDEEDKDNEKVKIYVCGQQATIKSKSNKELIFYAPSCPRTGSQKVEVELENGMVNDTLSFTYTDGRATAPTITTISPTSANPGGKGVLQITGTGFGTNSSALTVFLSNSTGKIYKLKVLQSNNTYAKVGLSGGQKGLFKVQINHPTTGDSVPTTPGADQFEYAVSITNVSPNTGSYKGGTLLTITGSNFVPDTVQTLAFVGNTVNWFCKIQTVTSNQIKCLTPPISPQYSVGANQPVLVATKLVILSDCTGNCNFSYLPDASSPNITSWNFGTSLNIVGTSLTGSNTCSIILINRLSGQQYVVNTISCSPTLASFSLTSAVVSGIYDMKIRSELGQSNSLGVSVNWGIGAPGWIQGSTAGAILPFGIGNGFPTSIDDNIFSVQVIGATTSIVYSVKIISCCSSNKITLELPPMPDNTTVNITFKGPTNTLIKTYTALTSKTVAAIIVSPNVTAAGLNTIKINTISTYTSPITEIKIISKFNSSQIIVVAANSWIVNGTFTSFSAVLPAGIYTLKISYNGGFVDCPDVINVQTPNKILNTTQPTSFAGGLYTLTANYLSPVSYILVNGFKGYLTTYSNVSAVYKIPALVAAQSQSTFGLSQVSRLDTNGFTIFSDKAGTNDDNVSYAFDSKTNTIYGSPNDLCWIGVDSGVGLQINLTRIRFYTYIDWVNAANYTLNAEFQGSNDLLNWTTLAKVDQTVRNGWNTLVSNSSSAFRYIRFSHSKVSQCNLAQIQLFGTLISNKSINIASQFADVVYVDGFNTVNFSNSIEYRQDKTPIIFSVTPAYGDIFGGYSITILGFYLAGTAEILIDGIVCANPVTTTNTQIICTVGARSTLPTENTFTVTVGGKNAIIRDSFLYVLKWSDSRTWGVDQPPIAGDLVYVPKGMTLLVDQDTPILQGITVENGTVVFSNEKDITVRAGFITLIGGKLIAGTEKKPFIKKLNFVMYGDYFGKQIPMVGNKGIGCIQCKLSIYGQPRSPTWTTISATISVGATSLTVSQEVDWKVGEEIVVASTSFIHGQAERRTIVAISGRIITVDKAFLYQHVSVLETYAKDWLEMRAQVGLLTRNIKIFGDQTSSANKYGSHLMIAGLSANGAEGQIAFTEFFNCGQPEILGRYCIHFHMNGEVPTSFVRGNSVHDSFARVVTLHGVHFLTVERNVAYRVRGHNFFLEDGIETKNVLRYNLAISSLQATNMLQTDTSVASFWITNPTNDFYGNRAAGSDFYGIWYEIKPNPDGPSSTNDVCPIGNPLGKVNQNIAHSNMRFGFRIFKLYSRLYPCRSIRDDSNSTDPWFDNPSIASVFTDFIIYKNFEDGVLAEQTGNVIFENFIVAENYRSGFEFYLANFTREPPTVRNSAIIGKSQSNQAGNATNYTLGMSALITPRSGIANFSNIRFYNYPIGSILIQTCPNCDNILHFTNLGSQVIMNKLKLYSIEGNYLFMIGLKRDVLYDLDGSLSPSFGGPGRASGTIISNWSHIASLNQYSCPQSTQASKWDFALMCDQSITIRRVIFTNIANNAQFMGQNQRVIEIKTLNSLVNSNTSASLYSSISNRLQNVDPRVEQIGSYSLPYITGRIYNIWWGTGIDFSHLSIISSPLFTASDKGIIFKFNYSESRQLFNVGPMRGGVLLTKPDYIQQSKVPLDPSTCKNGDHYHLNDKNSSLRMLSICQSGKNKAMFEYTEVNSVICEFQCPLPVLIIKQNFIRNWSNASQWPEGKMPAENQDVYINGNWTVLLDIDPAPIGTLTLDGTLFADDSRNVNLTALSISIRDGNITAGSSTSPFAHKFTIQINGKKTDTKSVINPLLALNKFIVVTGSLNLFGVKPTTTSTVLTQTAVAGSTTIFVESKTGWIIGDVLALGPSFSRFSEFENVRITAINADGSLTITPALLYTHYGSSSITIDSVASNSVGTLDARTRVGHLNRNVQIVAGPDYSWGFTLVVFGYQEGSIKRVGNAQLSGVQFINGGQLDTFNSPLVFKNVMGGRPSLVSSSTFGNCRAFCINVQQSEGISMSNNILYNAWVTGLQVKKSKTFTFTNNLIIGVYNRPTMQIFGQLVSCISILQYVNPVDNVAIKNNYCQGSQSHGYIFPHIKCTEIETNPFANNTVGSAVLGFIFNSIGTSCQAFSYIKAYACQIGSICNPPDSSELHFQYFVMADNKRSTSLRMGVVEGSTNNTAYLKNSYITAISRPTCTSCYGNSTINCSDSVGLRLFTATAHGQVYPNFFDWSYDRIYKQGAYDQKAFLHNVKFDNFKQSYAGALGGICSNNFVFQTHPQASDSIADHNLIDCSCSNCDTNSYIKCDPPNSSFLGWLGGCGEIVCTGKQNYLIRDHNGSFLGFKGVIVPNNSAIGSESGCTFSSSMNGYVCQRQDLATLQYESIAPDYNSRIMWPVNLTYQGSLYTTQTNGMKEWDWLGAQPQNHRLGRFISIIKLNSIYNMTFNGMPPLDLQFQIQKRTVSGSNSNYIIIKLKYPKPNSIRVQVKDQTVGSMVLTDATSSGIKNSLSTTTCGDNVYFFNNYTVHFVVTEEADCIVRVTLTESIQLTTHFAMDINDFFSSSSKVTNFINNLCALLSITDTSRVKVVGVYSGSTAVTVIIDPPVTNTEPTLPETTATIASTIISGAFTAAVSPGLGSVIGSSVSYYTLTETNNVQIITEEKQNIGLIVGVVILCLVILASTVLLTLCHFCRRRASVTDDYAPQEIVIKEREQIVKQSENDIQSCSHDDEILIYNEQMDNKDREKFNELEY